MLARPIKYMHTLHHKNNNRPFLVHILQPDETSKATLLSFTVQKDALLMGNIFEQHKKLFGIYPNNHFTYERPLEITFKNEDAEIKLDSPLEEIYIADTPEKELYTYCGENNLDLMILSDLTDKGKLQLITFQMPIDMLKQKFEENFK